MSYDLMVFDPVVAPRDRGAFAEWYALQAEWSEGHSYDDPVVTAPGLQAWYEEITKTYPNMNGPGAVDDDRVDDAADYSIGHSIIYGAFRWSQAEEVYSLFRMLAEKHAVGFYDVSGDEGDGEIYFPGDTLKLESQGAWREVSRQFKEMDGQ